MFICFALSYWSIDDKICVKKNGTLQNTPTRVQFYVIYLKYNALFFACESTPLPNM